MLSVSLFYKSIIELVTELRRECHVEVLLDVLVCMVVIHLKGGVELVVALLSSMVGRI